MLPAGREIEFHVTSLDVVHSFWAIELGVKADAVPGNDNVAYVKPEQMRAIQVRCAELCGLWHGDMTATARVVRPGRLRGLDRPGSSNTNAGVDQAAAAVLPHLLPRPDPEGT